MTKKEIDDLFVKGETITAYFFSKMSYTIGTKKITKKQFEEVLTRFKGRNSVEMDFGGWTKHYYRFKEK